MVGHVTQKYLHPQVLVQCKQQLKGIATDCSDEKQNDPKYPKVKLLENKSKNLPEASAPRVNSDIDLL